MKLFQALAVVAAVWMLVSVGMMFFVPDAKAVDPEMFTTASSYWSYTNVSVKSNVGTQTNEIWAGCATCNYIDILNTDAAVTNYVIRSTAVVTNATITATFGEQILPGAHLTFKRDGGLWQGPIWAVTGAAGQTNTLLIMSGRYAP